MYFASPTWAMYKIQTQIRDFKRVLDLIYK